MEEEAVTWEKHLPIGQREVGFLLLHFCGVWQFKSWEDARKLALPG